MNLHLNGKLIPVASYEEASNLTRNLIESKDWGGTKFYSQPRNGHITNDAGEQIAYVSYNGRVWQGVDDLTCTNPILFETRAR